MKFWKKLVLVGSMVIFSTFIYGWYLYNKKPTDVRLLKSEIQITAVDLLAAFKRDETEASKKYIDKIITVSGKIIQLDTDSSGILTIYLDAGDPLSGIVCAFYPDQSKSIRNLSKGARVSVKGICTGILMDVVLNKCSMVD